MPSYFYEDTSSTCDHTFRVETEGGESRRFKALFEGGLSLPTGFANLPTLIKYQSSLSLSHSTSLMQANSSKKIQN
jgi:hypothetical protein